MTFCALSSAKGMDIKMEKKRVFLIVLDSYGIGEMTDAADFGDVGANTLKTITKVKEYDTPNMKRIGLFNIDGVDWMEKEEHPIGSYARMKEQSRGKDTTIGHWEIAGVISPKPLPTYPDGFPKEVLDAFERETGRKVLCNKPYSGTDVIRDYGQEHVETGALIVYTSADSVFQIAAHEDVVPIEELYRDCEIARRILVGEHGVGRVIARPFIGTAPNFTRTANRHDFSLLPPKDTMLDALVKAGYDTYGVGKIYDIFAGQGIQHTQRIQNNVDGMEKTIETQDVDFNGICFVNLVDFDALWGHRRNPEGYGRELERFDEKLGELLPLLGEDDLLILTADHGNDPTYTGTDHTREQVPFIAYSPSMEGGKDLGSADTFAVIGATVADNFGVKMPEGTIGTSVLNEL